MGSRGLKNIPKYSKRFQDTPMITKKLKNSCAKSIMHSKRLLELKKLIFPPPPPPPLLKIQRIRGKDLEIQLTKKRCPCL